MLNIDFSVRGNIGQIQEGEATILFGDNGAGKTTICHALTMATTGNVKEWRPKTSGVNFYSRAGSPAMVTVTTDDYQMRLDLDSFTENQVPINSAYNALLGSERLGVGVTGKVLLEVVKNAICAEIDAAAILESFTSAGIKTELAQDLTRQITQNPDQADLQWKNIERTAEQSALSQKRIIADITGEAYGAKKSAAWVPPGWSHDWQHTDLAALDGERMKLERDIETAKTSRARTAGELDAAKSNLSKAQARLEAAEAEAAMDKSTEADLAQAITGLDNELIAHKASLADIDSEIVSHDQPDLQAITCPDCNSTMQYTIRGGKIELYTGKIINPDAAAKLTADRQKLIKTIQDANKRRDNLASSQRLASKRAYAVQSEKTSVDDAMRDVQKIMTAPAPVDVNVTPMTDRLEMVLSQATGYKAWKAVARALDEIAEQNIIKQVAGVGGARNSLMSEAVAKINSWLQAFRDMGSPRHPVPEITLIVSPNGLDIRVVDNGVSQVYPGQLSDGQQQYCSAALRLAIASNSTLSEAPPVLVCIDSIDSLDNDATFTLLTQINNALSTGQIPFPASVVLSSCRISLKNWLESKQPYERIKICTIGDA